MPTPARPFLPSVEQSANRLAHRLIGPVLPPGIAEALAQARNQGVDFFAPLTSAQQAIFRGRCAASRINLMGLFLGRPEAKHSEEDIETDLVDALGRQLGESPLRREAFASGASLNRMPFALRRRVSELPAIWRAEADQMKAARRAWAAVAERLLPLFSASEMLAGGMSWEHMLLLPEAELTRLFCEASRDNRWVDAIGHTPLSALALFENHRLGPRERSRIIQRLVAAQCPGMSPRVANPLFSLFLRAQGGGDFDQELVAALRAVGTDVDAAGIDGLNAAEMAHQCVPQIKRESSVHFKSALELETALLQKVASDAAALARSENTGSGSAAEPRGTRRL